MTDLEKLDKIIEFADHAHGDQMRKYTPDRYIVHQSDPDFAGRYLQECYDIASALTKGNSELRTIALEVVTATKKYN
jgi:hypothetical protein